MFASRSNFPIMIVENLSVARALTFLSEMLFKIKKHIMPYFVKKIKSI